jgi:hypothetical protein
MTKNTNVCHHMLIAQISLLFLFQVSKEGTHPATTFKNGLQKPLLNPCCAHVGLLFVNFSVLNRNQICRFLSLKGIKIMQT